MLLSLIKGMMSYFPLQVSLSVYYRYRKNIQVHLLPWEFSLGVYLFSFLLVEALHSSSERKTHAKKIVVAAAGTLCQEIFLLLMNNSLPDWNGLMLDPSTRLCEWNWNLFSAASVNGWWMKTICVSKEFV